MSEAEAPISKSDLPTRFVMGVVMVAAACATIYFSEVSEWGGWTFRCLVLVATSVMLLEWADMHRVPRRWSYAGAGFLALLLLVGAHYLYPVGGVDVLEGTGGALIPVVTAETFRPAWTGFGAALGFAVLLGLAARRLTMVGGFLYIAVPAFALIAINWAWFGLTFWMMVVTWATDIFAYFAGRSIGGPKLAPKVSPNKTWAGLGGGFLGAAVVGALAAWFFDLGAPFLYIGGFMGVIAQAGDLYESWLKRRAGVKDSGTILPGHGGALDRLDGLLPVILATFLILVGGLWTG